jgi:putative ABC transport system permease protein
MRISAPWRKAIRDIWRERTRASLVVLAIAIGLASFVAVLSTYAILQRELNRGYLETHPPSAVIVTDGVDDELIAATVARDDVDDADLRRVIGGRLQTADGSWRRMTLFVIRDFARLRIGTIAPEGGAWPPGRGEVLIERDAFQVANLRIGDITTIETKTGGRHTLRVAGRVHDVGQAQARMENTVYGYIAPGTLAAIGSPATLDQLYLLTSGNRFDETQVRRVTDNVKQWLEGTGHVVQRVNVPKPGAHPHAAIMGLLLSLMAAFGLFALTLSGVIVVNLLLAMLANERRQIGVMKAVGATRGQIARLYLAEAGVFGLAAFVLAIPAGITLGRVLSRYFSVLLNFDLNSLASPPWVYASAAAIALVVPLAAAAFPVAVATDITVREALDGTELSVTRFGANRFDRVICGVGRTSGPWLLGIRNSLRRRTRTALTLITLASAGTFFMSALSLRTSLVATADRRFGAGTFGADFRYAFDQHMLMIYVFLLIVAGVLASVGSLGLMTATSLNVLERKRELGVLRAIGASPIHIAQVVVGEGVFVTFVGWILAVTGSWAVAFAVSSLVPRLSIFSDGVDISFSAVGIVCWLLISTAVSVVSTIVPAISAARCSIREAISYE